MPKDSLFKATIRAVADRVAVAMSVPPHSREAFSQHLASELRSWLPMLGGERVYVGGAGRVLIRRKLNPEEAAARRSRILAALEAGEPARTVARSEGVTVRWVERLRASSRA